MRTQFSKIAFAAAFSFGLCFAQEITEPAEDPTPITEAAPESEPIPEPVPIPQSVPALNPVPAFVAELPKPMSVAQALSSISLPKGCAEDFASILGKNGFDMAKFMKELPQDVAKTKLQLKSPFGKPKDSDKTNSGLTVACIKSLPESPAELMSMLKNISLKMGLDLAMDVADNSIPANLPAESGSGDGVLKTVMSISLVSGGLGTVIYGIKQNGEVSRNVKKKNGKAAVDAESSRNMSYGIGAGLLAGGLVIYLVF